MFLDNLSTSVLRLCDTRKLSYETASERCDLSSRYFGDIARGKTAPTILTLEKLCVGFNLTPNDLLIPSAIWREMSFRKPMPVTQIRCFHFLHGLTGFPVCPQCRKTMEREYQPYCDRCGQCLDWKDFSKATIATVYKGNIIKNLIMDCQSYTKYRPNETTGGIFVSWRRKEELPTGA